jgi:hypothetical protein
MTPAKKSTKKPPAPPVPAEALDESPITPAAAMVCPDDFMPLTSETTLEDLSSLLHSINAFELAHNDTERRAYIRTLDTEQFAELWTWAREIEWGITHEGAGVRASRMMAPTFFHGKLAKDISTEEGLQDCFKLIIDDRPTNTADEAVTATDAAAESEGAPHTDAPQTETPTADGSQLTLVQEPTPPKKPLTPLTFQSGEQVASVRLALQARADDLRAEAKRLSGLGRTAEAAALEREAKDITEQLLRQVQSQTVIPFNESETLPQAIKRAVQGEVRSRARAALLRSVAQKKGETKQDAEQRALGKLDDLEALIGHVGEVTGALVSRLIVEASDRGMEAGRVQRETNASSIAREAIQAVEAALQRERAA